VTSALWKASEMGGSWRPERASLAWTARITSDAISTTTSDARPSSAPAASQRWAVTLSSWLGHGRARSLPKA
jgi:hypothetical protein